MTPRTTLAPDAPWPTDAELVHIIALAHVRLEMRLKQESEAEKAKKQINPRRKYQKAKA
jgi:hypothetical protein